MKGLCAFLSTSLALSASGVIGAALEPVKRASSVTPITIKGNAFWQGNKRFYIRGVDYQPGGSSKVDDPIGEPDQCKRDIAKFKDLKINTVRVYAVDNSKNHDECMKALADAGIYLALDVNTPKYSINRAEPKQSYNDVYLQNLFATVDEFVKYDNTLLFFSGNEVINDATNTQSAPYVKAVTRDLKQYMAAQKYRKVPVGYSAADVEENRAQMAAYMNCGSDDVRSDFFAFNDYSWCDPSSFTTSGWDQKVKNFSDYNIPLFLSEYGCNKNTRQFQEVKSLYSTQMTSVFSGGLVYEYSDEPDNPGYGLVKINGNSVTTNKDYDALKKAFAGTPDPSGDGGYKKSGLSSKCPTTKSKNWSVTNDKVPTMPSGAKKYLTSGAGKGKGLSGPGSQTAGTPSSGFEDAGNAQSSNSPDSGSTGTSSSSSSSASATKTGAAAAVRAPEMSVASFVCGFVVVASSLLGAALF
ncbi:MAG: beta-glucanosyltransferase [Chaenotheca gracillima]|nr:MAG: beta-glucanosyltransferase [Chaenotheca gracillima]